MIEIRNLRTEEMEDSWTRIVTDIVFTDMENPYGENTVWFATRTTNKEMLQNDCYDAFMLVPLYLAMYYKQDLHICGKVSKRLHKNIIAYVQTILCDFSSDLSRIHVIVDGYTEPNVMGKTLVGTGISCGIDSLSTIYTHFEQEDDLDYKINALFLFNFYYYPELRFNYERRVAFAKKAANDMGLPVYEVDSNLHAFTRRLGTQKIGYISLYSCVFALSKVIRRYYVSSAYSYEEIKQFSKYARDIDMSEFCESYLLPLLSTEDLELVNDGSQYLRTQKTELIADWPIAQKYLNVCIGSHGGPNCSKCSKCMRTLIPLNALGVEDKFSSVFDLDVYRKHVFEYKSIFKINGNKDAFSNEIVTYCRNHGEAMPAKGIAVACVFFCKLRNSMAQRSRWHTILRKFHLRKGFSFGSKTSAFARIYIDDIPKQIYYEFKDISIDNDVRIALYIEEPSWMTNTLKKEIRMYACDGYSIEVLKKGLRLKKTVNTDLACDEMDSLIDTTIDFVKKYNSLHKRTYVSGGGSDMSTQYYSMLYNTERKCA